jgi:chromosome partitioning protein
MAQPIIAFVSQKGGTGKSTLARALAAVVAHAGLKVRIADLDPAQRTVIEWEKLRGQFREDPPITVEGYETATEALDSAEDDELLIIDAPAHANRGTLELASAATLIVQPSGASIDDLRPAVLLFHELVQAGIPKNRLVIALCRILSEGEEERARAYIEAAGYDVLPGCVPERTAYREAQNRGRAFTESTRTLDERALLLMGGLYDRIALELQGKGRQSRRSRQRKESA